MLEYYLWYDLVIIIIIQVTKWLFFSNIMLLRYFHVIGQHFDKNEKKKKKKAGVGIVVLLNDGSSIIIINRSITVEENNLLREKEREEQASQAANGGPGIEAELELEGQASQSTHNTVVTRHSQSHSQSQQSEYVSPPPQMPAPSQNF